MVAITNIKQPSIITERTQLPIDWYLNPKVYNIELEHLFKTAPKYLGHQCMTPRAGDYHVLDWMDNAKALVNQQGEINLISNVCRHRQAIMLTGSGNQKHIVCPLHRWTYKLDGTLLGAPHFNEDVCLHLNKSSLNNWHGMLFEKQIKQPDILTELEQLNCKHFFDFTNYQLGKTQIDQYQFNWKTFIETYLEDYHVGPFHPGLNQFVNCDDLTWQFGDNFSVQTVGYKPPQEQGLTPVYQHWQQTLKRYQQGQATAYGAIWFVYYPYLMIEWYPNVLVVSHITPTGVESCTNVVEFYYPEDIALFEHEYMKAQQAAYNETAKEDEEICQRMHNGRHALYKQGIDQRGPYQHPMETGLQHFHLWYRKQLASYLTDSIS